MNVALCTSLCARCGILHNPRGCGLYIERASPNTVTALLVGVAGLSFLLKAGGGLYWMIPAVLAGLVGGVINAWLFLVRLPARSARAERDGADSNP